MKPSSERNEARVFGFRGIKPNPQIPSRRDPERNTTRSSLCRKAPPPQLLGFAGTIIVSPFISMVGLEGLLKNDQLPPQQRQA